MPRRPTADPEDPVPFQPDEGTGSGRPTREGPGALRRNPGPALVALGAFCATLALLLRFYVYGQLAVLPGGIELELPLVDESASYLDTSTWKTVEEAEVRRTTTIDGTVRPGDSGGATWEISVDTATPDTMLDHTDRRVIVDRSTGRAVNCCGEHVAGDRAVRQAGLVLYWPAGAADREHTFYDADIRAAPRMVFDGHEDIAGVPTRRYVQQIESTQIPDSARQVPASALDLERSGTVEASRWLELRRTYWVEPVSGYLVRAVEERRETLRAEDRGGERVLLDAELAMPDRSVAAYAERAENRARLLSALRAWVPIGLGAVGGPLVLVGLAWSFVRDRRAAMADPPSAESGEPEPAAGE
ncbi:hypothetical protein F4561_004654 [Lipingzhangella halophila]|uniref:DUF3068 domain-containing protein n=1 Tax=Lipingzhangella halophila TaxID=1783352 RepID=A0A7W7RKU6_9ACTN|nr:DUF3068 domain-containing protein [Lipingzhangella halophila]MBB4933834.1 hypothetical protein [Lipingzhangella halophila]